MKHKRMLGKLLLLFLTMSLLLGLCAACTTYGELHLSSGQGKTLPTQTFDRNKIETHVPGYVKPELPSLNFDREINILVRTATKDTVVGIEDSTDLVLKEIYESNREIEDYYGTELKWSVWSGEWNDNYAFVDRIETANSSERLACDLIVSQPMVASVLAERGLLANLLDTKYIDLASAYWPQTYLENIVTNGQLYAATLKFDYSVIDSCQAIFFNNRLLNQKKLESPFDLIANNEWTLSKLAEMIKEYDQSPESVPTNSLNRVWGYREASDEVNADWFLALGFRFIQPDTKVLAHSLNQNDVSSYLSLMSDFLSQESASLDPAEGRIFLDDRIAFYKSGLSFARELIADFNSSHNYGIIPLPKYSSDQKTYHTPAGNDYNVWMIPGSAKDVDESSAVLQMVAQQTYKNVYPVYFSEYVSGLMEDDRFNAATFDLICDSIVTDQAILHSYVYTNETVKSPWKAMYDYLHGYETNSVEVMYNGYYPYWQEVFEQILAIYQTDQAK